MGSSPIHADDDDHDDDDHGDDDDDDKYETYCAHLENKKCSWGIGFRYIVAHSIATSIAA